MLLKRAYISNNKICYRNSANIATYIKKNCIYTDAVYTQMIKKYLGSLMSPIMSIFNSFDCCYKNKSYK
ncbi:hypothetical protein QF044_000414 [Chryseobacterium sp. W4I1]|nr:hypothetical protein [Chryseobacterium sp. W4I1]